MRAPRLPATISVDVDPVDLHLIGYGVHRLPPDPSVYEKALPRLLERFAAHGVRATLFVVARDAAAESTGLRAAVRAGHEIASHSWSHPLALASLPEAEQNRELGDSRRALEQASGAEVVGFRAPNFDLDDAALARLAKLGYRYDASAYPTPLLPVARVVLALKGGRPLEVLRLRMLPFTWRTDVHRMKTAGGELVQFPVTVAGPLRMPVYHTLRYRGSDPGFAATLDGLVERRRPLSYVMHAVDVLGLEEDAVDRRLAPHPGMDRPLAAKLGLLDRTLAAIAARFECVTFRARLDRGEPAA